MPIKISVENNFLKVEGNDPERIYYERSRVSHELLPTYVQLRYDNNKLAQLDLTTLDSTNTAFVSLAAIVAFLTQVGDGDTGDGTASVGGGGGGLTQAQAQAAFTAALQSQSQTEFQDILLEDANGVVYISTRQVDEETGAVTFTSRLPNGSAHTPVAPIGVPQTQSASEYENRILAGQYGENTPNNFDVLFQVDMRDVPNNQWLMLYATSATQFNPSIGISVSNNGSDWDNLYQNGNYSVTITDQQGGDISGTSFSLTTTNTGLQGNPIWVKPPTRFIRFVDVNGGGGLYALTAYSSVSPPRDIQDTALVSQVTNLNNTVSYLPDEDRLYRVLVASTGFAVGDIARRSTRSNFSSPNSPIFTQWSNDTQKTIGLTAPTLTNLVALTNAQDGQNVDRKLNNTASAFQLKATNALIKSIYIDNLGALMYLQVHQGLTAAPATGAIPTEAYRIPANGSISLEFDRVYTGQVWLAFSTTAATFTASAVSKNIYTRFN